MKNNNKDGSKKNPVTKEKVIKNIIQNYKNLETLIVNQLFFSVDNHGTTIGSNREEIWKSLFEQMVPKKFKVERSVFIIDSTFNNDDKKTGVSNEVDIVIYDDSYTPYIFQFGLIKFIQIEAVAVAIECKSTSLNETNLKNWINSIQSLTTDSNSITRLASNLSVGNPSTQTSTRPLLINCNLYKNGSKKLSNLFDIVLNANAIKNKISIFIDSSRKNNLIHYFYYMNHSTLFDEKTKANLIEDFNNDVTKFIIVPIDKNEEDKEKAEQIKREKESEILKKLQTNIDDYRIKDNKQEVSLLSLNFILNQILMLLNNPMLFPHMAYVNMFNKVFGSMNKK